MVFSETAITYFRRDIAWLAFLVMVPEMTTAKQRPFFLIAHMTNSKSATHSALKSGANALEVDVQFDGSGRAVRMYHGFPCDFGRKCTESTPFTEYLDYLRDVTSLPRSTFEGKMRLLYLDLKTSTIKKGNQYRAGVDIVNKLIQHLWKNVPSHRLIDVVVAITSAKDRDIFRGAQDTILKDKNSEYWKKHIGFGFDGIDSRSDMKRILSESKIFQNRWVGSGITNWWHNFKEYKLRNAVACRDGRQSGCDYVDKVFTWTLDKVSSIAHAIKLGLDAVMTNNVKNALAAMKMKDVKGLVRLAGPNDSAWTRVIG